MEPDVVRMYSSSPPPLDDGAEEDENDFGDFGTFSGVPNSISFSELDTPTTFNQNQALTATSPPEPLNGRGGAGFSSSNGTRRPSNEVSKANGPAPERHPGSGPSDRTEVRKAVAVGGVVKPPDCNGGGAEVLTNGFVPLSVQGSPSLQNSVQSHLRGSSTGDTEEDFADFAAFSNAEGQIRQTACEDSDGPPGCSWPAGDHAVAQGTTSENTVRDTGRTGPPSSGSSDRGPRTDAVSQRRDAALAQERLSSTAACTDAPVSLNGVDGDGDGSNDTSPDADSNSDMGQSDEKGSGTETETETSFGRALSTDALEEYGDMSTTGSAPSPSLLGETTLPADGSRLAEDDGDDEDDGSFGGHGFADFIQTGSTQEATNSNDSDDFGDFNSPELQGREGGGLAESPPSDSFGNFSSAAEGVDAGWDAFGEQEGEGESWAAFSTEQTVAPPAEEEEEEEEEEEWHEGGLPAVSEETNRTDRQPASLSRRLEKLFQTSFPQNAVPPVEDQVTSLGTLLAPPDHPEEETSPSRRSPGLGVWTQLRDVTEAVGLRYQWGGSHCNKTLLCCLGIDTRNILFTGQKKQPVIVPMYAASLGMLEPTKEPVKPVSAAEMIAAIGQAPPVDPESGPCPPDSVQEALPPVQFDWSSSGLTNPLDASGGSALLILDFFGPVEDSGSTSSASIPGVDPELFELTTSKMDSGGAGSRVADAFARLMSTMEKTSTSTRKLRKEENLSAEAAEVIAALPDLSFMHAKVLMFPATLTPIGSQATPD
ncbi:aftiphilin a [Brachionichthys hirsutus]|uniref:aftiphilin a n=1 Tax=Brachionichthys hirsutus TaxID=412623 RepID=UPI003604D17B